MVPLPNSSLLPGAVIQVTAGDGKPITTGSPLQIRWLGSLQGNCKVPENMLAINAASIPGITSDKTFSFDASIAAKAAGLTLGSLGANVSHDADLSISTSADQSLNYLQFTSWVNDPINHAVVDKACGSILTQPNVFIIQEAFVISAGDYNFKNSGGAKISVAPPNVPVNGSADVSFANGGTITIKAPTVFALKALQEIESGSFQLATVEPAAINLRVVKQHQLTKHSNVAIIPPRLQPLKSRIIALDANVISDVNNLPPSKVR